jgi:putative ABC transport system permease protein
MFRLTLASLLAHRLRLILTAVTIAIGAGLVAGTFILTDSVRGALTTATAAASAPAVVVQPASAGGGKAAGALTSLPASLAARMRAVPGAASAQGLVTASKVTMIGKDGHQIRHQRAPNELLSYPTAPALAAQFTIDSGRPPRRPGEALLDAATARGLGYRIGDRITVVTPAGQRSLTVTGITGFAGASSPPDTGIASFDAPTVLVVQTAAAQQLTGLPGRFTQIDVLARPGVPAAVLGVRVARLLPPGAEALTGQQAASQQAADAASHLGNLQEYLLAFSVAALLVAGFVIASTLSILTTQRTREYALLRVIGAGRGQVLRSALAEAAMLGLAASAAGVALGVAAAAGLHSLIALLGGTLPAGGLVLAPRTIAAALATGTAVTVSAALRPARRAAQVRPVRALREAAAPAAVSSPRGRLIAGITGLAAAAGLLAAGSLTGGSMNVKLAGAGAVLALAAAVSCGPQLARPAAMLIPARVTRCRRPGRRANVPVLLARDNTALDPRRTAALAGILTVGLATAATVSIIATSAQASARDAVTATSHASLYLQGSIGPDLARAVAARPGVTATARIDYPLVQVAGTPARVDGIDPAGAATLIDFGVRTGSLAGLHGNGLFVSRQQAARHGWHLGSPVTIGFGQGPARSFRVAGTFADKRFLGDDYLMPIATLYRDMPGQLAEANLLLIRVAPGAQARVRAAVTALLARYPDAALLTPGQYRDARAAGLADISRVLDLFTALSALAGIIAALGIASALTLSVAERARELAVLRALGLTRHQLAAMIRAESVITCLLGALPGAALGTAAGAAIAAALTRSQTGTATITVSPAQLIAAIILTCLAALLPGLLPARHAARTPALRAIGEQQ